MNKTISAIVGVTEPTPSQYAAKPLWMKNLNFIGKLVLKVLYFGVLGVFAVIVAFNLVILVKSLSAKNSTVDVLGFRPLAVLSGSMSPSINYGDLIIVQSVQATSIKEGDVVTYSLGNNVLVSHRILHVVKENDTLSFITKGDANNVADKQVSANQIIGKCYVVVPLLGYISIIGSNTTGKIVLIMVPLFFFFIIIQAPKFVKKIRNYIRILKIKIEKVM